MTYICLVIVQLYETTSEEEVEDSDNEEGVTQNSSGVVDLEDLGKVMKKMKTAKVYFELYNVMMKLYSFA